MELRLGLLTKFEIKNVREYNISSKVKNKYIHPNTQNVSFTLSAQSNDSPDPLLPASGSVHTLDHQSDEMDHTSSTLEDIVNKAVNSYFIPIDSTASPLKPSSDIHNLGGSPRSSSPQPGTSSSSDTPQLSATPPNGTSQSSDIAPGDNIHLDSDSTRVTPPPNDPLIACHPNQAASSNLLDILKIYILILQRSNWSILRSVILKL